MEFVIVAILFCIVCSIVSNRRTNKQPDTQSRVPHVSLLLPFRFPIANGLYHLYQFRTGGTKWMDEVAKKFGYFFEMDIGPKRFVVTGDANVVQKILGSMEPTHLNKTKALYDLVFIDCFKDGLLGADYDVWAPHRKMLNRCFTYKCYLHYVKIMNRHARDFARNLQILSTPASSSQISLPLDHGKKVFDILYFYSAKIICQILMDTDKYGTERLEEFAKNLQTMKHFIVRRLLNPQLHFQPYWYCHSMKKDYDTVYSSTIRFFRDICTECRKENETKNFEQNTINDDDGVKPFRCVMKEMINFGASDKEIYDEVGTILGAGHETTVVSIQMLLQHFALNPEHQSRCRKEVKKLFENKGYADEALDDVECEITVDDLTSLKYLERCILESGRLTATVPLFMRTLGSTLKLDNNLELVSGTNLVVSPWMLHRNPKYFPNPEKFDPDRFLPEQVKNRHPYAYIPFSGGARNCIGYKVALLQLKMIMIWLLRKYEIRSDDKLEDVRLLFEVTLHPERDFRIKFIPFK